ncbi:MAG: HD domain-containing phosphohydrolase [bacterium]
MSAEQKSLANENYMLQRKNDLLKQLISVMNTTTRLDNILRYILELAGMVATAEASFILTKENVEGDNLVIREASGSIKRKDVLGREWPVGKGVVGEVYCSGKERVVNSPASDPGFTQEIQSLLGVPVQNLMAFPLNAEGAIVGALEVVNKKDGMAFDDDDRELVSILAEQAAGILGHAAAFKTTEAKIKRFNTLIEVSKEIASINDIHTTINKIMEAAKKVMRAEASSLFLLDEKNKELFIESALGDAGEKIKTFRLPLGKGIAGWVAQKGKPELVPDAYQDKRFNPEFDKKTGFRTRSILCVPLEFKKKTKGVVQIINSLDKESFEEEDIEYMIALGGQAAVAVENAKLLESNKELFMNIVTAMVKMIDSRYKYFAGHSVRVAKYATAIGNTLGLPPDMREKIQVCAFLHDLGRMQIPEGILLKPGKLTPEEMEVVKKQPVIGAGILKDVKMLDYAVPAILYHMEQYNGKGYPKGLQGEQIPLIARILSVANAFDAMSSERPFRPAMPFDSAKGKISAASGSQFDPLIVSAFIKAYDAGKIKPAQQ